MATSTGLLASCGSEKRIIEMINKYYYRDDLVLQVRESCKFLAKQWDIIRPDGSAIEGMRVIKKSNRFRFEMQE